MNWSWKRRDASDDLVDEVRSHLLMAAQDHVERGASPEEAAFAARREFGNVGQVLEVTREMHGGVRTEQLLQDVRYAARSLRRAPTFAVAAVLTLALGIGSITAVFTLVNGVLLRPLPFADPRHIYMVSYMPRGMRGFGEFPLLMDQMYLGLAERQRSFSALGAFGAHDANMSVAGREPWRVTVATVTPSLFAVLGVAPRSGRLLAAADVNDGDTPAALISERVWRSRFGADGTVLGRPLQIDGNNYTVVGIMPADFTFPFAADVWTPLIIRPNAQMAMLVGVVGRLRPNADAAQGSADLERVMRELPPPPGPPGMTFDTSLRPLEDLLIGDRGKPLVIFLAAVAFVLLIACANVANLFLVRAASRHRELAVRTALGAARGRLVRQLLTEGALIALAGGVGGLALSLIATRLLVLGAPPGSLPNPGALTTDSRVLGFTFIVTIATGIMFGLAPALRATRRDLANAFQHGGRTTTRHGGRLRASLVVGQTALAIVLLSGAGLMIRSFARLRSAPLGVETTGVVAMTVELPRTMYNAAAQRIALFDRIEAGLRHTPGSMSVGAIDTRPLQDGANMGGFRIKGRAPASPPAMVTKATAGPGFFETMRVRIQEGREFTRADNGTAPRVAVISKSVADQFWPGESPLGKRISLAQDPDAKDWDTIVGVVDDIAGQSVRSARPPTIYEPIAQVSEPFRLSRMTFVARGTATPAFMIAAMRRALSNADRALSASSVESMDSLVLQSAGDTLFQTRLLTVFSVLALVLAGVGIYGVLAYSVGQRSREIGVRLALGADRTRIMRGVIGQAMRLIAPGIILGVGIALSSTRMLTSLLYGTSPRDPEAMLTAMTVAMVTALAAAWVPAWRAANTPLLTVLQSD